MRLGRAALASAKEEERRHGADAFELAGELRNHEKRQDPGQQGDQADRVQGSKAHLRNCHAGRDGAARLGQPGGGSQGAKAEARQRS